MYTHALSKLLSPLFTFQLLLLIDTPAFPTIATTITVCCQIKIDMFEINVLIMVPGNITFKIK